MGIDLVEGFHPYFPHSSLKQTPVAVNEYIPEIHCLEERDKQSQSYQWFQNIHNIPYSTRVLLKKPMTFLLLFLCFPADQSFPSTSEMQLIILRKVTQELTGGSKKEANVLW